MLAETKDRRNHPRIRASIPVRYKALQEHDDSARNTLTKNVSEGGIKFVSEKFLPLACRLVVELSLPSSKEPVKVVSRIAWITKQPVGDNYEVGNQFLGITVKDKTAVSRYLREAFPYAAGS